MWDYFWTWARFISINQIELETFTTEWRAEVYVGQGFVLSDMDSWGQPEVVIEAGTTREVRSLNTPTGDSVILWITETGVTEEWFRFDLAEVTVR